jgi:hypothetical protein
MGKGCKPRPTNKKKFDNNWDSINWKSKTKKENGNGCSKDEGQVSGVGRSEEEVKGTEEVSNG